MGQIKVDEGVLRRAVANLELNLNQWDQNSWVADCGTTACLAGWIVATEKNLSLVELENDQYNFAHDGVHAGIAATALDLLGLTDFRDRDTFYHNVFLKTAWLETDENGCQVCVGDGRLAKEPAALKDFKERITLVTGVKF